MPAANPAIPPSQIAVKLEFLVTSPGINETPSTAITCVPLLVVVDVVVEESRKIWQRLKKRTTTRTQ